LAALTSGWWRVHFVACFQEHLLELLKIHSGNALANGWYEFAYPPTTAIFRIIGTDNFIQNILQINMALLMAIKSRE
jgi:hypothetical protein